MSIIVTNNSTASIGWGTRVIPSHGGSLLLDSSDIGDGLLTLSFEQFSINISVAIRGDLGVSSIVDTVKWVEDYYNDPEIAMDKGFSTGDMNTSTFVTNGIGTTVDSSNRSIIKIDGVSGSINTLAGMTMPYAGDPVGVLIKPTGEMVTSGPVDLIVINGTGTTTTLDIGSRVYMDNADNTIGIIKNSTPGGQLYLSGNDIYLGEVSKGSATVVSGGSVVVEVNLKIRKNTVWNPTVDGSWVRKKVGESFSWTDVIDGGTY